MIVLGGCVQAAVTPGTNDAARRVLRRFDIELYDSPSAGCCGAVDYHLVAQKQGLECARRNIDAWWPHVEAGAEAIVTTASGCGVMVKDYGELLKDDESYASRAQRVSELAKDLCEVLEGEDLSVFKDSTVKKRTAVHCPCTLMHGQKLGSSLERILERAGVPLAETTEKHLSLLRFGWYLLAVASRHQPTTAHAETGGAFHWRAGTDRNGKHWLPVASWRTVGRSGAALDRVA
jgi:glycolate oxidase iron-sulfur subunit